MQERFVVASALLMGLIVAPFYAVPAAAATYRIVVTNITAGQISGPPIVITHDGAFHLFTAGAPATEGLAIMAEDAALDTLITELEGSGHVHAFAHAAAPLPPGQSVEIEIDSAAAYHQLSAAQMLVTTNDTFWAVHNVTLPVGRGRSATYYATAWDAGSEANTELCTTVAGPPCGASFARDPDGAEGFVSVANGIHGIGDLSAAQFDWRNPTTRVEITRIR